MLIEIAQIVEVMGQMSVSQQQDSNLPARQPVLTWWFNANSSHLSRYSTFIRHTRRYLRIRPSNNMSALFLPTLLNKR